MEVKDTPCSRTPSRSPSAGPISGAVSTALASAYRAAQNSAKSPGAVGAGVRSSASSVRPWLGSKGNPCASGGGEPAAAAWAKDVMAGQ
ncbi:hypothetical protein GA0115239_10686 [Streptomyces sp. BpilaLS-43]|nr:hypothetical protein GA0115239_10686 [Streptomyces sp. BpilaLS-43]